MTEPMDDVLPTPGPPRYTQQLRQISRLTQLFHARMAASVELNGTALDALEQLMNEGPLTPSELAARLQVTPAAVTGVIDRLAATGHAHRERDDVDRRSVRIVPNPESIRAAAERIQPLVAELATRLADYSPAEMAVIERFLDDVAEAYQAGIDSIPNPLPSERRTG